MGAQSPTKIPKRSACAEAASLAPFFIYQMVMDPSIERKPSTAQTVLSMRKVSLFIEVVLLKETIGCDMERAAGLHGCMSVTVRKIGLLRGRRAVRNRGRAACSANVPERRVARLLRG